MTVALIVSGYVACVLIIAGLVLHIWDLQRER